ncbi:tRNA (adenine-N(1))-methyltransferase [Enterococcus faecalis]|uniref:tRNA (adenine(22)-N(1))-methyltransferase n=1 Tax=Enterococcus faecalis TaxID=1351 RepID=UPI000FFEFB5F|nr:tRNA (adenine-N(1))-methyltransferase [Enterococcus faecalis]
MNENQLSKRLATVGDLIPRGSRLADIGSDHAYLPVALMLENKLSFAVAGEVVEGPYQSAKTQVSKSNLTDKIIVRLANGLDAIEPEDQIDVISICGMGGTLIRDILEAGRKKNRLTGKERLILQPNIGEPTLRRWLMANDYSIIDETIVEENRKLYEIIVAEKTEQSVSYTDQELLFGPVLIKKQGPVFTKKWQRELKQRKTVLAQLAKASGEHIEKQAKLQQDQQLIEEVLANGCER